MGARNLDLIPVVKKALKFVNLLDSEGNLSITNLAVAICLYKIYVSPDASITEVGALFVALTNYAHKRLVTNQNTETPSDPLAPQVEEMQKRLNDISSSVSALNMQSGIRKV